MDCRKSSIHGMIFRVQHKDEGIAEASPKYLVLHELEDGTEIGTAEQERIDIAE